LEDTVVIRIASKRVDSQTIVSVAGKLEERHLAELQKHCAAAATALTLDLSDLKSADNAAIGWLGERLARGDEIKGASPYIKLLLEREMTRSGSLATTGSRSINEGDD